MMALMPSEDVRKKADRIIKAALLEYAWHGTLASKRLRELMEILKEVGVPTDFAYSKGRTDERADLSDSIHSIIWCPNE